MAATMLPFYCSEGALLYLGPQHLATKKATIFPSRATIVPSSTISPFCNMKKVDYFLGNKEVLLKNNTKPISRDHQLKRGHHFYLKDIIHHLAQHASLH